MQIRSWATPSEFVLEAVCRVDGSRTGPDSSVGIGGRAVTAAGVGLGAPCPRGASECVPGHDGAGAAASGLASKAVGNLSDSQRRGDGRPIGQGRARTARARVRGQAGAPLGQLSTSACGERPTVRTPTPQPRHRRGRARIRRPPRGATEQDPHRPRRQHERQGRHQNRARCADHRPDRPPTARTSTPLPFNSGFTLFYDDPLQ